MQKRHKRMDIWLLSMGLVEDIYGLTQSFPHEERFGLVSQMRRCAVSIPSNIAEGAARNSDKDFIRFLVIARGSLMELDTQLIISRRLGYLVLNPALEEKVEHIFAKINALITTLKRSQGSEEKRLPSPV